MSVFSKVLLFINLFVALFLLFLTSSIVAHRTNWTKRIDELKEIRDGIPVDDLLAKLRTQDPERYRQVTDELKSRAARRQAAGEGLTKDDPLSEAALTFIKEIGPEGYKRILQKQYGRKNPELLIEERELASRKATNQTLKDGHQADINDLTAAIARLNERIKEEQDYEKRVQAENADRRREIAQLYMELEEAVAGRNLAQSQERDMRNYLDLTRKQVQALLQRNQGAVNQIRKAELGGGGN